MKTSTKRITRRGMLQMVASGTAALALPSSAIAGRRGRRAVIDGHIKQSVAFWCWAEKGWDLEKTCHTAKQLGCKSVELLEPEQLPVLNSYRLKCAITMNGVPGLFVKGLNNLEYHKMVITSTKSSIDAAAEAGSPNVIAFTGYKWRNAEDPDSGEISLEEGATNCVTGLKKLAAYAKKKKVTVCIEQLNTRDDTHPMKGHPGYQGDHMDYVAEIVKRVGSPWVKLLFDIYHVQIMDGDVIRRIRQYGDLIGHVHVAGNPGRGEPDEKQEINYPACMRALLEAGYTGFVGQEFIPTRDPFQSLTEAVVLCDVVIE